jgi:hypothetical protein
MTLISAEVAGVMNTVIATATTAAVRFIENLPNRF